MKQTIFNVCCFWGLVCCFLTSLVNADVLAIDGENNTEAFKDYEISSVVPVPTDGIEGRIVEANPPDACSNISHPPFANSSMQWFVLISGDACNLNVKIYFAQAAGFSAAVIYKVNPKESNGYKHTSRHLFPHPNISAVWIMERSGLQIKAKYLYTSDERSRIIIFPNHSFNLITFLLLFAIVAGTCVIMMLLFAVIKCIQQSRQRRHNRLSSRHLKQLPTSKYKKGDPYDICAICLEDYNEGDKLRILPCSHAYHTKCIDPWLTNNRRTCPVCKRKVILIGVHSDCDSDSDTDSRAETTPLLRPTYRRNQQGGGTFSNSHHNSHGYSSSDRAIREGSGESTSRDAASAAFDESSDDNSQPHQRSPTLCSSHYLEVCPESNQSSSQQILAVPCNSVNSVGETAEQTEENHLVDVSNDCDDLITNENVNRISGYKKQNTRPLVV